MADLLTHIAAGLLKQQYKRLSTWVQASGPATSLQTRVSHFTESLLSAANSTFPLPHLPPLPANKTSLLPPLPWAVPENAPAVESSHGEPSPPRIANSAHSYLRPSKTRIEAISMSWYGNPEDHLGRCGAGLAAALAPEADVAGGAAAPAVAPGGADAPALAPGLTAPDLAPAPAPGGATSSFPQLANPPVASAAARSFQAAVAAAANATAADQQQQQPAAQAANATSMPQSKAIGNLIASSVQLGADLAASGHAVSLAAQDRVRLLQPLTPCVDMSLSSTGSAWEQVSLCPLSAFFKTASQAPLAPIKTLPCTACRRSIMTEGGCRLRRRCLWPS